VACEGANATPRDAFRPRGSPGRGPAARRRCDSAGFDDADGGTDCAISTGEKSEIHGADPTAGVFHDPDGVERRQQFAAG